MLHVVLRESEDLEIDLVRAGPGFLRLWPDALIVDTPRILAEPTSIPRSNIQSVTWRNHNGAGFRADLVSKPSAPPGPPLHLRPSRWRDHTLSIVFVSPVRFLVRRSFKFTSFVFRRQPIAYASTRPGWKLTPGLLMFRSTGDPIDAKRAFERWGVDFPEFANEV